MLLSMFLFYSPNMSQEKHQKYVDLMKAVLLMQPNELSLTAKITFILMAALHNTQ